MAGEIEWLQQWYRDRCNGSWEHDNGIRIDTLDNPGWSVRIDLAGTALESTAMTTVVHDRGEADWIRLEVKDGQFVGHGDPDKLAEICIAFQRWWQEHAGR